MSINKIFEWMSGESLITFYEDSNMDRDSHIIQGRKQDSKDKFIIGNSEVIENLRQVYISNKRDEILENLL